jgi:hypothetical protein
MVLERRKGVGRKKTRNEKKKKKLAAALARY